MGNVLVIPVATICIPLGGTQAQDCFPAPKPVPPPLQLSQGAPSNVLVIPTLSAQRTQPTGVFFADAAGCFRSGHVEITPGSAPYSCNVNGALLICDDSSPWGALKHAMAYVTEHPFSPEADDVIRIGFSDGAAPFDLVDSLGGGESIVQLCAGEPDETIIVNWPSATTSGGGVGAGCAPGSAPDAQGVCVVFDPPTPQVGVLPIPRIVSTFSGQREHGSTVRTMGLGGASAWTELRPGRASLSPPPPTLMGVPIPLTPLLIHGCGCDEETEIDLDELSGV